MDGCPLILKMSPALYYASTAIAGNKVQFRISSAGPAISRERSEDAEEVSSIRNSAPAQHLPE